MYGTQNLCKYLYCRPEVLVLWSKAWYNWRKWTGDGGRIVNWLELWKMTERCHSEIDVLYFQPPFRCRFDFNPFEILSLNHPLSFLQTTACKNLYKDNYINVLEWKVQIIFQPRPVLWPNGNTANGTLPNGTLLNFAVLYLTSNLTLEHVSLT